MKHCLPTYLASSLFLVALTFGAGNSNLLAQAPTDIINAANAGGSHLYPTTATDIDSVTVGATMPYYVLPDLNFNPLLQGTPTTTYDVTKIYTKANISSTFLAWTLPTGFTAAHVPNTGTYTDIVNLENYMNVTIGSLAIKTAKQTITVTEQSNTTYGGCTGTTSINVQVLNLPTATFTNAAILLCPGTTKVNLPLTVTTDMNNTEKQLQFEFTCTKPSVTPDPAFTLDASSYALGAGSVTPQATLAALTEGIYTFTLTKANDRISRKCGLDTGSLGLQQTYKVYVFSPKPTLKTSATP